MPDEIDNLRKKRRFDFPTPLAGIFNGCAIRLLNVGEDGLHFEHEEPMKIGATGKLRLLGAVDGERMEIRIRILWSRLGDRSQERGKSFLSGAKIEEDAEQIAGRLGRLIRAHGRPDTTSMQRKVELRQKRDEARRSRLDRSIELENEIVEAKRRLTSNPVESLSWYNRARYAIAENPSLENRLSPAHRQDILAVWEYLERRVSLEEIAKVFDR